MAGLRRKRRRGRVQIDRRQVLTRTPRLWLASAQHHLLHLRRPSAIRLAQRPAEHLGYRIGQRQVVIRTQLLQLLHGRPVAHQEQCHVSNHLARRRHLNDVAERHVDLGVGPRNVMPSLSQAHGFGLFLQIRILPARHLVQIDLGRAGLRRAVERRVVRADRLPIIGGLIQRIQIQARIAFRVRQRRDNGVQVRLTGGSAHGCQCAIGHMHSRFSRLQNGCRIDAAGVVRVEVDRQPDLGPQRLHQLLRGIRLAQPCHVLDGENLRAHPLQLLRHLYVVGERILVAFGIEDIARIADGRLADPPRIPRRLDGNLHVGQPVQRIEDAEDIDALRRGFFDELPHHVIRIRRIAHCIRGAQQHLKADVRNGFPQPLQPLPGIFVEEPQRDVEGRAAPHFQAVETRHAVRDEVRNRQHVVAPHPRRKERLMRIPERSIGQQQPLLRPRPLNELPGSVLLEIRLGARGRGPRVVRRVVRRDHRSPYELGLRLARHFLVTVDDDLA